MLELTARTYRTIPLDRMGYETRAFSLDPARTALVVMHCWDIGCEGGPPVDGNFFVGMGSRESFEEANSIMRGRIRPALDAARRAGVLVCHVEAEAIAKQHPQSADEVDAPQAWSQGGGFEPAVPGWYAETIARAHGKDYAIHPPYCCMGRARVVEPKPDEPVVYQTGQMHRVLRRHRIQNLLYTGFATDMCILRAPGGLEPMAPYGYRLFLLRDATCGIEFPDTIEEHLATRYAIRYFESHGGCTLLTDEVIGALHALPDAPPRRER